MADEDDDLLASLLGDETPDETPAVLAPDDQPEAAEADGDAELDALLGLGDDEPVETPVATLAGAEEYPEEKVIDPGFDPDADEAEPAAEPVKKTRAPRAKKPAADTIVKDEVQEPTPIVPTTVAVEGPEAARIRELEAKLAAPSVLKPGMPITESLLTPDQKRIRELEALLAAKTAKEITDAETEWDTPADGQESILIHFIRDGFTAMGVIWCKGQELEFPIGGQAYQRTQDKNGESWVDKRNDPDYQYARWGDEYFREGPWRGRKWGEVPEFITDPDEIAAIKAAGEIERKRNRAAPIR